MFHKQTKITAVFGYNTMLGCLFLGMLSAALYAEDGSRLWLRYEPIKDSKRLAEYREQIHEVVIESPLEFPAAAEELKTALSGLLDKKIPFGKIVSGAGAVVVGTPETSSLIRKHIDPSKLQSCGLEGYSISTRQIDDQNVIIIAANQSAGLLYGVFHFLRLIQTRQSLDGLSIQSSPRIQRRLLNHWDNLDGSVERGYAGRSIWDWENLPDRVNPIYKEYARANASVGINGTVLNNVNSQVEILTTEYLKKAAAIADVLRPYEIRVYLSVKFTSPIEIGGLSTADPLDLGVQEWWNKKADEIYELIPDFGGFLVKAYSEGQPGPQMYGRSHADGANMLAHALAPHGGFVMWRTFVYDLSIDSDRTKCGYLEFVPLDGKFADNVFLQTKNGPVDFQPREPFNPLFGAMPQTPLMMELQITQEYTGQAKHLVYLAPQWKEVLDSDTYAKGPGTTAAKIIDGTAEGHTITGIAGVSGIGLDKNRTGHHFSQANWYAFGRLAWNPDLTSDQIAEEWIRMTWSNDNEVVKTIEQMMAGSWEACVDYMTPLGLHHIMAEGHHYGPQPDYVHPGRFDWSSTYYHRADEKGLGYNRSSSGTGSVRQYHPPLSELWDHPETCPEKYLLWFHHIPWDYRLSDGRTLWQSLQYRYQRGVDYVREMQRKWDSLENQIDPPRYKHVNQRLAMQYENACKWWDVCLGYFGQFVKKEENSDKD